MKIYIKNADYYGKKINILTDGKTVARVSDGEIEYDGAEVIDADGLSVMPAFVDIHTHLREPGFEGKETIKTGAMAAVAGGFASVCCMPNTNPVTDNEYIVKYIRDKAREVNLAKIYPIGAITKGEMGAELAEMGKMKEAGAVAVSDDGVPVSNANIMRLALEYADGIGIPVISHSEDLALTDSGVMNEGETATGLGLRGITRAAEETAVAREIIIADALKTKIHIAHISTGGSVRIVRDAKAAGIKVTAETCPHYFAGTDKLCGGYNATAKVNPPLRTEADRLAIIEGIKDGTVDAIATDHAPHKLSDKNQGFDLAANGISGLETAYALGYTYLVKTGEIALEKLSELMTEKPAKILDLPYGQIKEGGLADLVLADNKTEYKIDSAKFKSKGKNTPFDGLPVFGKIKYTIVEGEIKYAGD